MFYNCQSMISLTDISKWKFSKVIKIDEVFNNFDSINILSGLNSDSKNNILSLKLSSESNNNYSEKLLSDINENNSNDYFNFDYFDKQNDDNQYYYDNFYLED